MVEQPSYRVERINELIRRELVMLLRQETKDPRLQVVRITDVLASRDLSSAKVFYTVPEEQKDMVVALLKKASGFFRSRLSKTLDLRHTPELKFIYDSAPNTGARIDDLLAKL
ncbi:30S ribosome-binding factor RbfA [bacterium endosymbiont of Bathymodiolus sp. 5 South]|jgi:ribosome-binding factor A|uniref:30S ribosome-binding factor RbfA n=1 Tax=bacterium endosymbiont of Bathymodiolus sp. 5 South TaxID=1181670 RepID=UPI0010B80844|nr:30S ribosome-binding factor RbfA [bacterium endosymbiont of Bathymodiolus sp. 5 South]CAC9648294.1 Ribosome-binding factor A [uncultured Gammaproteobacteria bacterium]CAC9648559.1 Ribosome-binding factor A [uncultured Gammaproteobacteria bacterium]SHN91186.1 Ribosome-binding factor A [bacterium endosymbiont of Bathymodiolus sp. 5 South]VVH58820.1 Ribosome-binding factor A [uncultured Gammaproteobacteria bacterium]VVH62996.1 Ribosome-binding factor A [uncultured Gammaproteobacteria bacterium